MEISPEIYAAIEKQLSSEACGILKAVLIKAESDSKELEKLKVENKRLKDTEAILRRNVDDNNIKRSEIDANFQRIKEIEVRERNLAIEELKYKLQAEKDKTEFTKTVALGLVRNSEYRNSVFENGSIPHRDNNGTVWYDNQTRNFTEIKLVD